MIIGKIGSVSEDGSTILYDKYSDAMIEAKVPKLTEDIEIIQNERGEWRIVLPPSLPLEIRNRLEQSEAFYYATRHFLSYQNYLTVVKQYPTNCYTLYKQNPFFLCSVNRENSDSPIISVSMVDKHITLSTFEQRLQEMKYVIWDVLEANESNGHTWMPYQLLKQKVKKRLSLSGHPLRTGDVASFLRYYNNFFYFEDNGESSRVALKVTYQKEYAIYRAVLLATEYETPFPLYQPSLNEDFTLEQRNAVKNIILKGGRLSILTGGPGTGKTTIIRSVVETITRQYPDTRIHLLSPTGRAAKRITEVFEGRDVAVSTVHKFLGYGHTLTKRELSIIRNAGLIIVDESSMLDLEIFGKLLSLLDFTRTKLILVGDVDQLPSIGAGNVLCDLIHLGVHTEYLTKNHRSQGGIIDNAHKINHGDLFLEEDESFEIEETPECICDFLSGMEQADIVITPYRVETWSNGEKTFGASEVVNKYVQKKIFPDRVEGEFHLGDAVIMTKTNYKQGYFNGETGVIISQLNGEYLVGFGDRELVVRDASEMSLGYAITVHKSQGSEYPISVIDIPRYADFITRRMLYTAVTRAKRYVKIRATKECIRKIIMNNPEILRRTFLSSFTKIA